MKFSLFTILLASLLVAFTSALASDSILSHVDTKKIKPDVLSQLKKDIDNCEKSEKNKSDFVDCVKDQLNDYDSKELTSDQKKDIKSATKDYNFSKNRSGPHYLRR